MTTAENVQMLYEGGYEGQAIRMAEAESITVHYSSVETGCVAEAYEFPDGSVFTF